MKIDFTVIKREESLPEPYRIMYAVWLRLDGLGDVLTKVYVDKEFYENSPLGTKFSLEKR